MGINHLLRFFEKYKKTVNVSQFNGMRVGIDGFVWLHKSIFAADYDLVKNPNSRKYIYVFLGMLRYIKSFGIIPIVVFDGFVNPLKKRVIDKRSDIREDNRIKAESEHDPVKKNRLLTSALKVTPMMAYEVAKELDKYGVYTIFAPYEADAQLAFLDRNGLVDAVMTCDSDLVAYGVRNVILDFKSKCPTVTLVKSEDIIKTFVSYDQFLDFCILCGCDYCKIPGVSANTAMILILKYRSIDGMLNNCLYSMYEDDLLNAKKMFLHQIVYDVFKRQCVYLKEIPNLVDEKVKEYTKILGEIIPADKMLAIQNRVNYIN